MKGPTVIVAIDVGTDGCFITRNSLRVIGLCAINQSTGQVLFKFRVCLSPIPGREMEQRYKEDFWDKHPEILDQINKESVDPHEGILKFSRILDGLDETHQTVLVTDNPTFDMAWINYYVDIFLGRLPIYYKHNDPKQWRAIYDTDSYAKAATKVTYAESMYVDNNEVMKILGINPDLIPTATHMPDEDAENIARLHREVALINCQRRTKEMQEFV
jgi:hypothetical protein